MRSKHNSKRIRTLRRRRLALALITAMAAPMALAQSPSGGNVVPGSGVATIDLNGNQTTITQTTKGAIIDWASFNIGTGYGVTFDQQFGNTSVTLNRVVGFGSGYAGPSLIDGTLTSNGNVFIINPAGITFGGGSQITVGGLVASTLWLSDANFANGLSNGNYVFSGFNGDPATTHQVRNNGEIIAGAGGVGFVGTTLWNSGSITANGGNIVFGAGSTVTLDYFGDGLTQVTINVPPTMDSGIIQGRDGQMIADGGKILLRTAASAGGTGGAIFAGGLLQANTIANLNGRVELTSAGGPVMLGAPGIVSDVSTPFIAGRIDVSGNAVGESGGSVLISGNGVMLVNSDTNPLGPTDPDSTGSSIRATGRNTGGNITITSTGDITALQLTQISASGEVDGSGGTINISANGGNANLFGNIGASSGKVNGNGGQINISARDDILQDHGSISASARGSAGQIGLTTTTGDILLTDIVASGRSNGGSINANAGDDIRLYGNVNVYGQYGNGGAISLDAAGAIYGYGALDASGGVDGGSIYLGGGASNSIDNDTAAVGFGGSIDARGGSGDGGIVQIHANGGINVQGSIYASGGRNGGEIHLHGTDSGYYGGVTVEGTLDAAGASGNGGIIDVYATGNLYLNGDLLAYGDIDGGNIFLVAASGGVNVEGDLDARGGRNGGQIQLSGTIAAFRGGVSVEGALDASGTSGDGGSIDIYSSGDVHVDGDMLAWGGVNGGDISIVGAAVDFDAAAAYGTVGRGGSVRVTADDMYLFGFGNAIDVQGETGGGTIDLYARYNLLLPQYSSLSADTGSSGYGGSIHLYAGDSLVVYGDLSARGVDGGGSIYTGSGGGIDLNGIGIDTSTLSGVAGTWTISAPQMTVLSGSYEGYWGEGSYFNATTDIQDNDLNNAFANGTNIVLQATNGDVQFDDAQILAASSSPMFLHVNATGAIYGSGFSIGSSGGALAMLFNADSAGGNDNGGYIDFNNASLTSNGGLIAMFGQSDQAAGFATGYGNGIALVGVDIASAGGDVALSGHSTGGGSGTGYAGVYLDGSDIYSGGGNVGIYGSGAGSAHGVFADLSSFTTGAGNFSILGVASGTGDGVRLQSSDAFTDGGDFSIDGTGGGYGVYVFSPSGLQSGGGDVVVHGEGGTEAGTWITGEIDSAGGSIDIYGVSTEAQGLFFMGGYLNGITSTGGDITLVGYGATGGATLVGSGYGTNSIDSAGGLITIIGAASAADGVGVLLSELDVVVGAGDVMIDGTAAAGTGILFQYGASVSTTTGAINLIGEGANFGLDLGDGALDTDSGDINLDGTALAATATAGVRMTGGGLVTNGGDITVTGNSAGGTGVQLGDGGAFAIDSGGGAIAINGAGVAHGVQLTGSTMDSGGGGIDIEGTASGTDAVGVSLDGMAVNGGAGDVSINGSAALGSGLLFANAASISTTSGAITLIGIGDSVGLTLDGGEFSTDSGHIDLRGRGLGANSDGLLIGSGISIVTNGGGIDLSGEGGSGAGISLGSGSMVDAGNSLVVLRAGNDGSSDAIRLQGAIRSGVGVNLRPGGVDANGGLTERVDDDILLGGGTGFALSGAELAMIDSPELIIGSSLHAGSIQVLGAVTREGNMTLQNDGGSGGIDIQAGLNVGNGTLALSSGGSITQTSAGAITAHSLLANAGVDVLLGSAQNNVAATTLAGSAGGAFEFQDVDTLAIGSVSAVGFDAASGGLSSLGAIGIDADGNVLVQNLAGDLILNEDIQGNNIDLVTAGRLQNLGGASLIAAGDWRVWANTWEGETRGGLAGSGDLPNLYGCTFLGSCGVTVPATDNHFIYVQQPTAVITFDSFSREYGLPNPDFTFTVAGAILGDTASNVASGTAGSAATIASDVGNYAITGQFTSAAGYLIQLVPGTLGITPATLFFTADSATRYLGSANPNFTGTVTGFRNDDSVQSVFGTTDIWSSPANFFSQVGFHPINGGGTAKNYVFSQAPGNATALQIIPLPQLSSTPIDLIRETINTYVYDRNFGGAPVCAINASIDDQRLASSGDELSNEWSKVRSRPNLTNCFDTERQEGCGSF